jgi:NAD(P)-dependent dehydrogenase (short-subunit alcohol dehydrogenase family)
MFDPACRNPSAWIVAWVKGRLVMKIQGSIALVTGANRGLGKALVGALLEAGAAKIYAAARDERKVSAESSRVVPLRLDTSKPAELEAAGAIAKDVTLLINNAGVATSFNVLTANPRAIDTDFQTNVMGTLAVIRTFLPVLERARGSTVVNILSLASLGSFPALGGYSASKAAAYSVTQALRPELKRKHVDVLAALPGPIDTDMVRDLAMPKTSAADVARGVLAGIERGDEEIFPDPMAEQMGALWRRSAKDYERAFASL